MWGLAADAVTVGLFLSAASTMPSPMAFYGKFFFAPLWLSVLSDSGNLTTIEIARSFLSTSDDRLQFRQPRGHSP